MLSVDSIGHNPTPSLSLMLELNSRGFKVLQGSEQDSCEQTLTASRLFVLVMELGEIIAARVRQHQDLVINTN